MKKQKRMIPCGRQHPQMPLLQYLKERSSGRLSKLEAYLDLVDKAAVQYIPKDLCRQTFTLADGQFVITITELAECWHWHRATVRIFIEQLERMGQLSVTRLTKSQIITFPQFAGDTAVHPFDGALEEFRQEIRSALSEWASGRISASACASACEQHYTEALDSLAGSKGLSVIDSKSGEMPHSDKEQEAYREACRRTAVRCICEAAFHRVLCDDGYPSDDSLTAFFHEELASDWQSFIEASTALSELAVHGKSLALDKEHPGVKAQFRTLCKPFLAVVTGQTAETAGNH